MRFGFDVTGVLCNYRDKARPEALDTVWMLKKCGHAVISISGGSEIDGRTQLPVLRDYDEAGFVFDEKLWKQKYKVDICTRKLIDVFVDDDTFNLRDLDTPTKGIYLNERDRKNEAPEGIVVARDWTDVRKTITELSGVQFPDL